MSTYAYTAFDSKGKLFRGNIEEKTWTRALRRVKEMGLFPASVKERPQRLLAEKLPFVRLRLKRAGAEQARLCGSRISEKVIAPFTRQLATLIEAGIPLLRGLRSIQEQEENSRLRALVGELGKDIEGGSTLSEALRRHPKVFSSLYVNMVVAGETAGLLENALTRLADFMERSQKVRSKIKASLVYPIAVVLVAVSVMAVITMFVIPRIKPIYEDFTGSRTLPAFTEFVLNMSGSIKNSSPYLALLVAALIVVYKIAQANPAGRALIDRLKLRLPVLGRIARKAAIARLSRTLGAMLQSGVPILQALNIARDTATNSVFAGAIEKTHQRVKDGDTLTAPLQASGVFPATVLSMIDVGEQSGALPDMLLKVADNYDEDVDRSIAAALSLLEPALIIFLAVMVGAIVIAVVLPIIGITLDPAPGEGASL
jgi:type IV pilus assembly protein PilC